MAGLAELAADLETEEEELKEQIWPGLQSEAVLAIKVGGVRLCCGLALVSLWGQFPAHHLTCDRLAMLISCQRKFKVRKAMSQWLQSQAGPLDMETVKMDMIVHTCRPS